MTTRHEAELRDIERMLSRPTKGEKVTEGMMKFVAVERQKEKDRAARTAEIGNEIKLAWAEGEPEKWNTALAQVTIGSVTRAVEIDPHEERDGKLRLKPAIIAKGYRGLVEAWALWKWHSDRGSEIDDADKFILDCEAPKMVWEEAEVKRGPGRPKAVAAA